MAEGPGESPSAGTPKPPAAAVATAEQLQSVKEIVRNPDDSRVIDRIESERRVLQNTDLAQRIEAKKLYARRLLLLLAAQIAFVDLMFLGYAQFGVHWKINPTVMNVWLGATVVEVVGIVLVVTKNLFPPGDFPS